MFIKIGNEIINPDYIVKIVTTPTDQTKRFFNADIYMIGCREYIHLNCRQTNLLLEHLLRDKITDIEPTVTIPNPLQVTKQKARQHKRISKVIDDSRTAQEV